MERIIKTCFGDFEIIEDRAVSAGDKEFFYTLPSQDMTDKEIQSFMEEIKAFES